FGRDDMLSLLCRSYGTQEAVGNIFYKHIVPTGLKKLPKYLFNLHTGLKTRTRWQQIKLTL
ncbi:MAG: hypothetical protein OXU23_12030, partial [Candidatus Poribacteria bacterium]|nr:hypothetical protein [Candidatus Poribacteria bacterium]